MISSNKLSYSSGVFFLLLLLRNCGRKFCTICLQINEASFFDISHSDCDWLWLQECCWRRYRDSRASPTPFHPHLLETGRCQLLSCSRFLLVVKMLFPRGKFWSVLLFSSLTFLSLRLSLYPSLLLLLWLTGT